jgi:hypothetical protein
MTNAQYTQKPGSSPGFRFSIGAESAISQGVAPRRRSWRLRSIAGA